MAAPPSDLATLPKAELHIHLEGAVRPATLEEFASREGVTIPKSFDSLNTVRRHVRRRLGYDVQPR